MQGPHSSLIASKGLGPQGAGNSLIFGISPLALASWTARSGSFCSAIAAARLIATPANGHVQTKLFMGALTGGV